MSKHRLLMLLCLLAFACFACRWSGGANVNTTNTNAAASSSPTMTASPQARATVALSGEAGGSNSELWQATAVKFRGRNGERFEYNCPAGATTDRTVWGTDVYTDDSAVCRAAVHAGLITPETGGRVTIEIRPGQESYQESTRHGVATDSYGSWEGSFVFVTSK